MFNLIFRGSNIQNGQKFIFESRVPNGMGFRGMGGNFKNDFGWNWKNDWDEILKMFFFNLGIRGIPWDGMRREWDCIRWDGMGWNFVGWSHPILLGTLFESIVFSVIKIELFRKKTWWKLTLDPMYIFTSFYQIFYFSIFERTTSGRNYYRVKYWREVWKRKYVRFYPAGTYFSYWAP